MRIRKVYRQRNLNTQRNPNRRPRKEKLVIKHDKHSQHNELFIVSYSVISKRKGKI